MIVAEASAVEWSREVLTVDEPGVMPCPETIDITGRERLLVFGPMQILPAGAWRLEVRLHLSEAAARNPYVLQFILGLNLKEVRFQPHGAGEYRVSLDNQFDKDAHAALRLWLARAAFHGELRFLGASVQRLAAGVRESVD